MHHGQADVVQVAEVCKLLVEAEQRLVEPGKLQHLQAPGGALRECQFCNGPEVGVWVDIQSHRAWHQCCVNLSRKVISVRALC